MLGVLVFPFLFFYLHPFFPFPFNDKGGLLLYWHNLQAQGRSLHFGIITKVHCTLPLPFFLGESPLGHIGTRAKKIIYLFFHLGHCTNFFDLNSSEISIGSHLPVSTLLTDSKCGIGSSYMAVSSLNKINSMFSLFFF